MSQMIVQTPSNGITVEALKLGKIGPGEVLVRFLAAPINPLDLLVLADTYPTKPKYEHNGNKILGYDGVGEVLDCGETVEGLQPGDVVVPSKFGIGTWRTHAILEQTDVQKITRPIDITFGAILKTVVLPAYLLVEDLVRLKPGDWLMQNAATSAIAQMVVQFARIRGVHVISVIRDRDQSDLAQTKQSLLDLGVDECLTEAEVADQRSEIQSKHVVLALDSVFGTSARLLLDAVVNGGTFAQLGFLGGVKEELTLTNQDLFFRNIVLRGFRGTQLIGQRTNLERRTLFDWFVKLFNRGDLVLPPLGLQRVEWKAADPVNEVQTNLSVAIENAKQGRSGQRKQVIEFL